MVPAERLRNLVAKLIGIIQRYAPPEERHDAIRRELILLGARDLEPGTDPGAVANGSTQSNLRDRQLCQLARATNQVKKIPISLLKTPTLFRPRSFPTVPLLNVTCHALAEPEVLAIVVDRGVRPGPETAYSRRPDAVAVGDL